MNIVALEHTILSGTQSFVCQLSSKKSEKPTVEIGSLFTLTLNTQNIDLIWHVLELSQSEWQKCCDNWLKRMQKCMEPKWGIFWKTIKRFAMINICFCSLITKYRRQPSCIRDFFDILITKSRIPGFLKFNPVWQL